MRCVESIEQHLDSSMLSLHIARVFHTRSIVTEINQFVPPHTVLPVRTARSKRLKARLSSRSSGPDRFTRSSNVATRCSACRATSRNTSGSRAPVALRSEEHTSELQSRENLVCRLLLEKKKEDNKLA